ncbi:MAG: tetratricopeptide repeat protein [Neorhizobium sp.]|nr:tetratricopeptide repeat protein [Neorhizobium sp.]
MLLAALPLLLTLNTTVPEPPPITWEWFNAAETYRRYKVKGRDDLAISAHYFRLAAVNGNAAAAYKLGEAYERGEGVPQSPVDALFWYRQSAASGDRYAELRIGWFYQKGIAVPVDVAAAIGWYEKAAAHDNIWAYHMLAVLYAQGEGVPQDLPLARRYFEHSLPETKDAWAAWRLSQIIGDSDPRRRQVLVMQAAKGGNAQALEALKKAP